MTIIRLFMSNRSTQGIAVLFVLDRAPPTP